MLKIRQQQIHTFEDLFRRRLAASVVSDLAATAPHTIAGLDAAELERRVDTALLKAEKYGLTAPEDVEVFVKLSLVVGPNFDDYPPFQEHLSYYDSQSRVLALVSGARPGDWTSAAQFDIVSRYRKQAETSGDVLLVPLDTCHTDAYFHHALHPDVWRLGKMSPLTSRDDTESFMRTMTPGGARTGYAVSDNGGRFLGACIASRKPNATGVSYWVPRHLWGMGIASRALGQLSDRRKGEKLVLNIDPCNIPSQRVAENCDFRQVDDYNFELQNG